MKRLLNGASGKSCLALAAAAFVAIGVSRAHAAPELFYNANVLVADQANGQPTTDPKLLNPWGIAFLPGSPFWISDNNSGFSTLYDGTGAIFDIPMTSTQFFVTIPPPTGQTFTASPTGIVANSSTSFCSDLFIFDTEDGTLSGWQLSDGGEAELRIDNSKKPNAKDGAVYKGLELATPKTGVLTLYATDFRHGTIDTFQTMNPTDPTTCGYQQVTLDGNFADPFLPLGYAPFNVKLIDSKLFVTYALQDAARHDDVPGPGNGFVDTFDTDGHFLGRFASRGDLNAPWGLSIAPPDFGIATGQLLVGNFGDGHINVFQPNFAIPLGQLQTKGKNLSQPLVIPGLWTLINGTGALNAPDNSLYFSAGPDHETHGQFGTIAPSM